MIEWSDDLASGHGIIDAQHRQLFDHINLFIASMADGTASAQLESIAGFLQQYIEHHFKTEEMYMDTIKYPEVWQHKAQHRWFENELRELTKDLKNDGPRHELCMRAETLLIRWFLNHVRTEDMKLGAGHHKHHKDELPATV